MEEWESLDVSERISQEMELDYRRYPRPLSEEDGV
jgi:hypothetical protein